MDVTSDHLLSRLKVIHEKKWFEPIVPVYPVIPSSTRKSNRCTSVRQIQRVVADYYKLSLRLLCGDSRRLALARPRQVAMYLACELTGKSSVLIGNAFNRDHTTILHGRNKIEAMLSSDRKIAADIAALKRKMCGE